MVFNKEAEVLINGKHRCVFSKITKHQNVVRFSMLKMLRWGSLLLLL